MDRNKVPLRLVEDHVTDGRTTDDRVGWFIHKLRDNNKSAAARRCVISTDEDNTEESRFERYTQERKQLNNGKRKGQCVIVLRGNEGETRREWNCSGMQGRGKWEIPEKTRQPAASSGTIPTCENMGSNRSATAAPRTHWNAVVMHSGRQSVYELIGSELFTVNSLGQNYNRAYARLLFIRGATEAQWLERLPPKQGEKCSIPGGVAPGFSHVGIVPNDASRRVFSGSPVFPALGFQCCSILTSLYPHRLSRPKCEDPPRYLHSTPLHSYGVHAIASNVIRKISCFRQER
ncbi:hypothetical protein PR048_030453 [Dryococelus australis]|uniref:Uncharacterized protein n=1 Tax=Dryococelus australis TaxID=614101 RepID=A0ABQ9G913_9NEOP|nr:hypothetical protein PR048_030453 [Dryococelus australis]